MWMFIGLFLDLQQFKWAVSFKALNFFGENLFGNGPGRDYMGQLTILGTILYTDNLGTSFRTCWVPQWERKNWVPTLPYWNMSQKSIFPPITDVLFSTFSLLRCHSISFLHLFLSTQSHFLSSLCFSFFVGLSRFSI